MSRRIAVMQPYFYPYAGYFRLFAAVDEFVLLDCVQFPRRGRVHRSAVEGAGEQARWLTLPLARQPREVRIRDLAFAADARSAFDERLRAAGLPAPADAPAARAVDAHLRAPLTGVVDFLEDGLRTVVERLGLSRPIRRSSSIGLADDLRGQDRILAICRACGADEYLNPPGGRALYSREAFARAGVSLQFLDPYPGPHLHLLPALLRGESAAIAGDVRRQCTIDGVDANR